MALLGTLKGFGVTEIFQLISQQMKTGSLILTSPKGKVTIAFQDGVIQGLISDRWQIDPRAELLLKGGFISEKEFKAAMDGEKKGQSRWHDILITKAKLKPIFLEKAATAIIRTTLLDIFQWGEGVYRFEDWDQNTEGMLTCSLPTEGAILDTLRIIDEWPMIKPKIPPVDYCPVTISTITEEHVRNYDLSSVDLHIFDLINGEKSVETIVREALETSFDTLNAFVKLMDAGLVEVFPRGSVEERDQTRIKHAILHTLKISMVYISLIVCIGVLIVLGKPRILGPIFSDPVLAAQTAGQHALAERMFKPEKGPSDPSTGTHAR